MEFPTIKFTHTQDGYDPHEVDAVMDELKKQIIELIEQNSSQAYMIKQYNDKVRQIAENTNKLLEEREKESRLVQEFLNQNKPTKE